MIDEDHARFDVFGHATPASDVIREHGTTRAIGRIVRQFDRSGLILYNTERFKNLPASAATADPARSLPVKETPCTRLSERLTGNYVHIDTIGVVFPVSVCECWFSALLLRHPVLHCAQDVTEFSVRWLCEIFPGR